jgi:DNA-binding MarR family transcriptional regulator
MKYELIPTVEELEHHAQTVPEINPPEVIAMLRVLQASAEIRSAIIDVLERDYQLSEGKLCVMIILHQHPEGAAPSLLASKAGVTRATISGMLRRMIRDGIAVAVSDSEDGRGKKISLTPQGREFMNQILPGHYLRITKLMGKLSVDEQNELIRLLKKIGNS